MIEVICDETDQKEAKQVPVKLPKNLRQIGEGTNDTKIYIEDFVITYIRKFADRDTDSAGILLGEVKESGKETYIFVPGAIELKNVFAEDGSIRFDDEVWAEAYSDIKQYFNKYMIVGWFLNRRSSCHEIDLQLGKIHIDNFPGADKIMFLSDLAEKEEAVYHVDGGELREQTVYYVYYERNADMQEYMAAPIVVSNDGEQQQLLPPKSVDAGLEDKTPENYRAILRERKEEAASGKHVIGVLYGACTFLAIVILMIGVAMMNNYDKIAGLEQLVSDLYEAAMERTGGQQAAGNSSGAIIENATGNIWPTKSTEKVGAAETTTKKQEVTKQTTTEAPTTAAATTTTAAAATSTEQASDKSTVNQEKETTPATETQSTTKTGDDKTEDASAMGNPVSYYVVQDGDTLTSISKKFYNTEKMVEAIKAFNQLDDENYIFSGQVLNLP